MEKQRPKLTDDDSKRTTSRYNTRSSKHKLVSDMDTIEPTSLRVSDERSRKSEVQLPTDLVVEILKRLPVKTLARFLCVSKVWGSVIRSRDFKKLFLAESSNRPGRLLFNFKGYDKRSVLFSSNQTLDPGEHSVATYHMTYPSEPFVIDSSSVHDLFCYATASRSELVVYNSTTKRSITLPKLEPGSSVFRHLLAYDPVDADYKVLCMTRPRFEFKVLTLGNGNEWRMVQNTHPHRPLNSQICTNGVLYYTAHADGDDKEAVVMRFDARSEMFDLIKGPAGADFPFKGHLSTITMYEGKLAIMSTEISASVSIVLWVLEDALKHQWLKRVFGLSNSWKSLAQETRIQSLPTLHYFRTITDAGEFILAPLSASGRQFYVLYYDPKRNSMRQVCVEGIMEHELLRKRERTWTLYNIFLRQIESLMF